MHGLLAAHLERCQAQLLGAEPLSLSRVGRVLFDTVGGVEARPAQLNGVKLLSTKACVCGCMALNLAWCSCVNSKLVE